MNSSQGQKFPNQNRNVQNQNRKLPDIHTSVVPMPVDLADETFPEKPSYFKYTLANPYNLTLLGGAVVASVLTFNPLIAVAALGLEGLWLLHGSQSSFMQRWLWDPIHEKEKAEFEKERRMKLVNSMGEYGRSRVISLIEKEQQIKQLAAQNPSFTGNLLRDELNKTSNLVNAFIDLGVNCGRYENYLSTVNLGELENQKTQWDKFIELNKTNADDMEIQIAKKNVSVIAKRIERVTEIKRYLKIAYGQLNLIENSFQLIADQIVTMQSPNELSGQLDELMNGVEDIKESMKETEQIIKML